MGGEQPSDEVKSALRSGETVEWYARPSFHSKLAASTVALPLVVFVVGPPALIFSVFLSSVEGILAYVLFGAILIGSIVGWYGLAHLNYQNTEYLATDERVYVFSGAVSVDFQRIERGDIREVRVAHSRPYAVFNAGHVEVKTDEGVVRLEAVERPRAVAEEIRRVIGD